MPPVKEIENILAKYAAGEALPEEQALAKQWASGKEEHEQMLHLIERLMHETAQLPLPPPPDEHAAWEKVKQRISLQQQPKWQGYRWLQAAAVFILIVGVTLLFLPLKSVTPAMVPAIVTIASEYGLRTDTLPDGSVVTLVGPSSVSYPQDSNRYITLTGQAFFKVKHDPLKLFVVKTKNITVTDIGTMFYISSTPAITHVMVYAGIIEVKRGNKTIRLSQDESIDVHPGDSGLVKQPPLKIIVPQAQAFPIAADFKDLPDNVAKQKQVMLAILRDIKQDALVDTITSFGLDANSFYVNNIPQSDGVYKRYKAKYLRLTGLGFYYGNTAATGTGFIFSKEELNN